MHIEPRDATSAAPVQQNLSSSGSRLVAVLAVAASELLA